MCIHCCRLRHTPCPPIPYACPHCPVHEIASACSVRGRKQPDSEHKWYMEARTRERYKNSCVCHTLPPRWLDINRNVIFELARRLQQSPEATHYMLLRLLHANYGKVMRIMKRRRSYDVPLASQALFFSPSSLIDQNGNLFEPMHPESVEKLIRLIQDYLHRMQLLNRKYKWFNNGLDEGDLMGLLSERDELLKLLCSVSSLCEDHGSLSMQQLLRVLNDLDLDKLFQKGKAHRSDTKSLKGISDLYFEVAAENPSPNKPMIEVENQQQQQPPPPSPPPSPPPEISQLLKSTYNTTSSLSTSSIKSAGSLKKKRESAKKKFINGETPILFYEPFNADKPWTWLSRMPQRKRLMQDGTIGTEPVRRYRPMEQRAQLTRMRENMTILSERSLTEGSEFLSTFGGRRQSSISRRSSMR